MKTSHSFTVFENGKRKKNIISAFLQTRILHQDDIDEGYLWNVNYPYQICFEDSEEGRKIIDNLPAKVIVSFQIHIGGSTFAVVRGANS